MNPPATRLRTVAVVLAGGSGSRVGLDIPKQLFYAFVGYVGTRAFVFCAFALLSASPNHVAVCVD